MTCLQTELIQKYIDGEASSREIKQIEFHIGICSNCVEKIEARKQLIGHIKDVVGQRIGEQMQIPLFINPERHQCKTLMVPVRRMLYVVSAASVLVLIGLFVYRQHTKITPEQHLIGYRLDEFVDANRPITDQPMVVTITDADGNMVEYSIE
jgi:hypothetical protein